jgi:SAM-dependent methyltransferase
MNPTERFTTRVTDYARSRPGYPPAVLEVLRQRVGLTPQWTIADIGSGTGISTELFLQMGNEVLAVEPNDAMRAAAEASLGGLTGFRSVRGTAEATTLPDASIDLVVAAQAFHRFALRAFRNECRRILKPGGWALLMWNDRDESSTPFLRAYEQLLRDFGTDYLAVRHNRIGASTLRQFFGGKFRSEALGNVQTFDFTGLRGRLLSSSYVPGQSDPRHQPMLDALREVFDAHQVDGQVQMHYQTQLYFAHLT